MGDGLSHGNAGNESWARRWSPVATHPHWLRFADPAPHVHLVMGALLLAVGAAGVLGNALVLVVFTRFRRLRGPFSAFIVNLAVADLTTSLLHGMVAASCFQGHWIFGTYGCILYAFGVGYFGLLSIVTLSAIAVERYLVITAKPMSASWKLSQFGARKVSKNALYY
ncbi:hypothetical protein R5R35_007429 [Gryllus longicercus]|uniref:G-protein coupled receptors family 1 profile domain-containing protein n=1 Tax=Gryllus longicercus TaxID=2509291 RepID=A0AAN9V5L6_9ORTH